MTVGSAPAGAAGQQAPAKQAAPRATEAGPVDVNTASVADLEAVPGIGKSLAARIVEFREKNGPFSRVDDLIKVRGVGEKSLERLRPHLTVGAARGR